MTLVTENVPQPGSGEVLVQMEACGVCRTDLHVAEGDLPVRRRSVIPGHEIVGRIVAFGPDTTTTLGLGRRVGIPWLAYTCGKCDFCVSGNENLCAASRYTGWDQDGGYAEFAVASAEYVLKLPDNYPLAELAPLLCAGIIGYRALRNAALPPRGVLGLYGFGGSAHIVAQLALFDGATVHVMTRDSAAREFALTLGASSAVGTIDPPPEPLDSAIIFAPVGAIVPAALEALRHGGTLALAGIHMSDVPPLNYERHLFHEKHIQSVEANTREDARSFLELAQQHKIDVHTRTYALGEADRALADLELGRFSGAAVLLP